MEQLARANDTVRAHVLYSVGAGFIPLPLLDVAAVTAIQLDMINKLSELYAVPYAESRSRAWIAALTGGIAARVGATALKFIPGVGALLGGVSMAALSGGSTYAVGQVIIRHYESGGSAENFKADEFRDYFREQFERGKAYAEQIGRKEKVKATPAGSPAAPGEDEIVAKLRELADLRTAGVISEEEFAQLKERLLKNF